MQQSLLADQLAKHVLEQPPLVHHAKYLQTIRFIIQSPILALLVALLELSLKTMSVTLVMILVQPVMGIWPINVLLATQDMFLKMDTV